MAFLVLTIALGGALVMNPANATNVGAFHPSADLVPSATIDPRYHDALAVVRPSDALKHFLLLAIAILIYQPAWFWYVTLHFPFDVARAVTYCLATPLAVFPSAYRAVLGLGLGQGKSSFYNKSVNSINTLIKFGGAFLLLASLAISASQCSPFRSTPVAMVSAPAFPDA